MKRKKERDLPTQIIIQAKIFNTKRVDKSDMLDEFCLKETNRTI